MPVPNIIYSASRGHHRVRMPTRIAGARLLSVMLYHSPGYKITESKVLESFDCQLGGCPTFPACLRKLSLS